MLPLVLAAGLAAALLAGSVRGGLGDDAAPPLRDAAAAAAAGAAAPTAAAATAAAAAAASWGARAAADAFASLPCYEDWRGETPLPERLRSRFGSLRELDAVAVAPFLALQRERLTGAPAAWILDGASGAERLRATLDGTDAGVADARGMPELSSGRPAHFVQRLLLPRNATVATFGDLHGSYHSFLRSLSSLAAAGFLDAETFAVAPAHTRDFFMLFLGDYVDRGLYGVEVLAALLQLKTASPDNVFMVRGNHEDVAMNGQDAGGSFLFELQSKFELATIPELRRVFRVYETLPVAIFLGALGDEDGGSVDGGGAAGGGAEFLQACHGGLEVGFDAKPLLRAPVRREEALASGAVSHFALLHGVMRRSWWDALPAELRLRVQRGGVDSNIFRNVGGCRSSGVDGAEWPLAPAQLFPALGFMWNDFMVDDELARNASAPRHGGNPARAPLHFRPGRGFGFGRELTEYVLRTSGIVGVLRAHQHNDAAETGPMLSMLKAASPPGVFDNFARSGLVLTFLSGALIPGQGFGYDAYGLLRLRGATAASWAVDVCANRVRPAVGRECSAALDFVCADMGWRASPEARAPPPAAWGVWRACAGEAGGANSAQEVEL